MKIKTASIGFITGLFLLGSVIVWVSSLSLSKTNQVQSIWMDFEAHRSNRLRALIALRSELGFGGMIHGFKNYILRQKQSDAKAIISSIGGAKAALEQYQSLQLNLAERQAIEQIEQILDAYRNALDQVGQLIQQQKTVKQIDDIVKINDTSALNALKTLEVENNIVDFKTSDIGSRALLLSSLRTSMGYGGLIHNFKNYILRHTPKALDQAEAEVNHLEILVKMYSQHELSVIEQNALSDILSVVHAYQHNLSIIDEVSQYGESPREIDSIVVIDDIPALEGFKSLQREIIKNNEARAMQLNDALRVVQISGEIIFYVTLVSFVFLIFLALWLINSQIVKPIARLTRIMSRLSNNDLGVTILGTKYKSEMGEIARSVEVFKINAIKKQQAENDLQELNEQLEQKVYQRTQKLEQNELRLAAMVKQAVEGEAKLKILVDTAMDAVIQIDNQGTVINWNKQAEKIFGWSNNEVFGRKLHELIIPEQYQKSHIAGIKHFLETEKGTILNSRIEITALHRDRQEFPIELTVSAIKYNGDYQFSAFVRDISEQKESERAIIKAKELAEAASEAKSIFLANMSHELRTPMHGILSFSNMGIKRADSATREKLYKYFSNIHISGDRLLTLLNDLLDLSKIEAGKMELNLQQSNLMDIYLSCYQEQEQHMTDLFINIHLTECDDLIMGLFDSVRVKQVMANILSNAIKFSPKDSTLIASLSRNNEQALCFSLQDSGVGIPDNELNSIFDAFIQSSKTKTGAGGTGLGLAICKEIIEAHHGQIWAENNLEGGALFSFIIPSNSD